jgi:hypothetical protein
MHLCSGEEKIHSSKLKLCVFEFVFILQEVLMKIVYLKFGILIDFGQIFCVEV